LIRATGALPDRVDGRDWNASGLVGALGPPPSASRGLSDSLGYVADQGDNQSCVGEAVSHAIYALRSSRGEAPFRGSANLLWYFGRKRAPWGTTQNVGVRPRDVLWSVTSVGICDEALFPRSSPIDATPTPAAWMAAWHHRGLSYHRIKAAGTMRTDQIKRAIDAKLPVVSAIEVDDAYFDSRGTWPGMSGESKGWHMVFHHSYDGPWVHHVGSYGRDWGEQGHCSVPFLSLENERARDWWVLTTPQDGPGDEDE
jgi:hypothetical protein